jgi:hypothetical protein
VAANACAWRTARRGVRAASRAGRRAAYAGLPPEAPMAGLPTPRAPPPPRPPPRATSHPPTRKAVSPARSFQRWGGVGRGSLEGGQTPGQNQRAEPKVLGSIRIDTR